MEKSALAEPKKMKGIIRKMYTLLFIEGGSYFWILFFVLSCGIFFDIGFSTILVSQLVYNILVTLFGLLLVIGVIVRIVKYEPEFEQEQNKQKIIDLPALRTAQRKVIYDPQDRRPRYLLEGSTYRYIPDMATLKYLAELLEFSEFDAEPILSEDTKRKFTKKKDFKSILDFCPKQDVKK